MNGSTDLLYCTVHNFRNLTPQELSHLCAELGLWMNEQERVLCRDYYRTRKERDPTVWELKFLDRFLAACHAQPSVPAARELITENTDYARAWLDIARQRRELGQTGAPTLSALASTCGTYLSRAGIVPRDTSLFCGRTAELAARCAGKAPTLMLDLGGVAAARVPQPMPRPAAATLLLALAPTGNEPFFAEITRFLATHRARGVYALCTTVASDLLPRLLGLNGLVLDAGKLPEGTGELLLLLAPEAAIPTLFATGAPLTLLGSTDDSGRLVVREGAAVRASSDLRFLRDLASVRHLLCVTAHNMTPPAPAFPQFTENAHTHLGGVRTESGAERALLTLLCELMIRGARTAHATLCAVLELPRAADTQALSAALVLLLELHRVTAELSLPSQSVRVITAPCEHPTLSVFVSAPVATCRADAAAAFQKAAAERDFTAMRAALAEKF
ncbi:MAG: hypothetical protein IJA78_03960 [Clostridia bacterium]|nr:hypothetical protein [Clostridia bacterium]